MIPKPISTYEQSTSFPWQQSVLIFQEKNESRKEGRWNTEETDMKRQNHYIQQDLLIDSPDYKNNIFFFFFRDSSWLQISLAVTKGLQRSKAAEAFFDR